MKKYQRGEFAASINVAIIYSRKLITKQEARTHSFKIVNSFR